MSRWLKREQCMKGKLKASELTTLIGAINRNAIKLTEGQEDAYYLQLGITTDSLSGLTYQQLSNILLRLQDFVDILPASAAVQFAVELSAASEPKNVFLEAVKADYEAKTKKEETQAPLPGGEVSQAAS